MINSIDNPFNYFTDAAGGALDAGKIYIGIAGLDPVANPITMYWDAALTITAAQPIRTSGGYPVYLGSAATLYADKSDYSIKVESAVDVLIYSSLNISKRVPAALVTYSQGGVGAVARTVESKLRESVSVKDFGAVGDGVTDDTAAIQAAIDSAKTIDIPPGVHIVDRLLVNTQGTIIQGASGLASVLKLKDGANDHVIEFATSNWQMHNIKVDGNRSNNTSGGGIYINNCYWNSLSNVDVREASGTAWQLVNSNNNVFTNCQVHNCDANGWYIDGSSSYNTWNAGGCEDVGGDIGFDINGIGNIINGAWTEWRTSTVTTGKVGYDINGRDNVIVSAIAKSGGGPAAPMGVGFKLGGSSYNCTILSAHCGDCVIDIELLGANQYRHIFGNNTVTNTDGDTTSQIVNGNSFQTARFTAIGVGKNPSTDVDVYSPAPVLTYEASNGASGLRTNLLGTSSNGWRLQFAGVTKLEVRSDRILPSPDNAMLLGTASNRWATVYAGTGTINTSDERNKTPLLDIDESELGAARELKFCIKKFKFNDSVSVKGDGARIHFGVGAQTVKSIFEKHGLAPESYALFCYDEWPSNVDEEGVEVTAAGNRYGIRYDQLLAFIIASL